MKQTRFFVAFACICLASMAQATVMNWYVALADSTTYSFTAAKIVAFNTTTQTATDLNDGKGNTYIAADGNQYVLDDSGDTSANITGLSGSAYSYFVELGNYVSGSWTVVAQSGKVSYDNLYSAGVISAGGVDAPAANSYNFANAGFSTVPEPGSLGMLLIGASLMLLRRRNRKA